jgi:hypothetical protein
MRTHRFYYPCTMRSLWGWCATLTPGSQSQGGDGQNTDNSQNGTADTSHSGNNSTGQGDTTHDTTRSLEFERFTKRAEMSDQRKSHEPHIPYKFARSELSSFTRHHSKQQFIGAVSKPESVNLKPLISHLRYFTANAAEGKCSNPFLPSFQGRRV